MSLYGKQKHAKRMGIFNDFAKKKYLQPPPFPRQVCVCVWCSLRIHYGARCRG